MRHRRQTLIEIRFLRKVEISDEPDGCWIWTGATHPSGHGLIGRGRRGEGNIYTHRLAYAMHAPIPDGSLVCHKCDNPPCVRFDHLFVGTHADNMADMRQKGRDWPMEFVRPKGEQHWAAKLTHAQVREIRSLWRLGAKQTELAAQFGVSQALISAICLEKIWKDAVNA